jgi:hypothetical protein
MQYTLLFDPAAVFNVRVVIVGEEGENLKRGKLFIWSQEKRAFRWVFFRASRPPRGERATRQVERYLCALFHLEPAVVERRRPYKARIMLDGKSEAVIPELVMY